LALVIGVEALEESFVPATEKVEEGLVAVVAAMSQWKTGQLLPQNEIFGDWMQLSMGSCYDQELNNSYRVEIWEV